MTCNPIGSGVRMSEADYYCPYDHLPCTRYDIDLGFGVCEVTINECSDVCSRFVLKPNIKSIEFFNKKALGEVVACRRNSFESRQMR